MADPLKLKPRKARRHTTAFRTVDGDMGRAANLLMHRQGWFGKDDGYDRLYDPAKAPKDRTPRNYKPTITEESIGRNAKEAAKRGLRHDGSAALTDFYIPADFPFTGKFRPDVKLASAESLRIKFVPPKLVPERQSNSTTSRPGTQRGLSTRRGEVEKHLSLIAETYPWFQGHEARKIKQRRILSDFAPQPKRSSAPRVRSIGLAPR